MRSSSILANVVGLGAAVALPLTARDSDIDVTVLQFALTLEHLENAFYSGALNKFSLADFKAAGYPATYYQNLQFIASDESNHVDLLSSALTTAGATPVAPCTYNFPYTDVPSFITLSSVLEGVGTSAYLGGAPLITSKAYLAVAGSILVTEALHTSYQRANLGEVPFGSPYGTALDPTSVYTLAAAFISQCPSGNANLGFTPFASLSYNDTAAEPCLAPAAGASITLTAAGAIPNGSPVTFVSGLNVVSTTGTISGNSIQVAIPSVIEGQAYAFITTADVEGSFSDSAVLFGPAIVEVSPTLAKSQK